MLIDLLCLVILVHLHTIAKLIFKTVFKFSNRTKMRTIGVLIVGMISIIYVELILMCGLPESLTSFLQLGCREPINLVFEYAIVFLFAAAEFLREQTPPDSMKEKIRKEQIKMRKKNKRRAFIVMLTFSLLIYLNETD